MRIPRKIKYLDRTVTLKFMTSPRFCQVLRGHYERDMIRLSSKESRAMKEETFLHELIHMVDYSLDEKHVERISSRLYKVITDNRLWK